MSAARLAKAAIKIPKRIERGPTDILRTLASTVKYFPEGPHQLLHDDPYLMPTRGPQHDAYVLSRLSGKNTARFLLNKHPEMFFRDDSEPKVRTFLPPEEFREDMHFTEDDLRWCIEHKDPINGMIAYKTMIEKKSKFSDDTLLDFFEMICFTNEEQIKDMLDLQKNFYEREAGRMLVHQTWKTTGLASKIFNQIKEDLDPPRVYSAMIAGLSKYNDHVAAKQVFDDFKENHPTQGLCINAYEGLVLSVPRLNSSIETAHDALEQIAKHMETHLVKPSLRFLNGVLTVYRSFLCDESTCKKSIKIVNDMRSLGIEPSLYTYVGIIGIICRSRSNLSTYEKLIPEILDLLGSDDRLLEVRDVADLESLNLCMRLISNSLHNINYANKLHKVYLKRPTLFPHKYQANRYLDDYFRLIITTDNIDNIKKFYLRYVPMSFQPGPDTYNALIEALEIYSADPEFIKRVGADIVNVGFHEKISKDTIFRKDQDYINAIALKKEPKRRPRKSQMRLGQPVSKSDTD